MVELFRYLKAALCASKRLLSGGEILLVSTSGSIPGSMLVSLDLQDIDAHSVTGSLEIREDICLVLIPRVVPFAHGTVA